MQARKNKAAKNLESPIKGTTALESDVERDNSLTNDQDMDEHENWARSPTEEFTSDFGPESRDHTQDD